MPTTPPASPFQQLMHGVTPAPPRERGVNHREQIYQAVVDLTNRHLPASRQRVADMLGLKLTIVDDHIKRLKDDGRLRLVVNGIVEPVEEFPPDRDISTTELTSGLVKVEIGDDIIQLTPSEARRLAKLLRGYALEGQAMSSELEDRRRESRLDRLEHELRQERKRGDELAARLARRGDANQHSLFGAEA